MRIFTGYFSKLDEYCKMLDGNVTFVSIANSEIKTKKYTIHSYRKLAPPWDIVKQYKYDKDMGNFTKEYINRVLNSLDQEQVILDLKHFAMGLDAPHHNVVLHSLFEVKNDIVLLCWESPEKFCHRQLVASWINYHVPTKIKLERQIEEIMTI